MAGETRKDRPTTDMQETVDFSVNDTRGDLGPLSEQALPVRLGRYQVNRLLGRGGMGAVFLARDEQLERDVALKVPKFDVKENEKAKQRFYREARAAANVTHPNLCPIYDVAEIDGIHCIAMAYIKGHALSEYISREKPPSERACAGIVQKVALAMEEAHQNGILHRDLKPANIMIDHRKEPIVMDFGLACPSESGDESRITQDGTLIGSPAYMSPEQLRGDPKQMGPASDQYSLGVVLFQLLCGALPFDDSSSTITLLTHILTEEPRNLAEMRKGIDPRLVRITEKAIAKDPAERFASMKQFAAALASFIRDESPKSAVTQPVAAPAASAVAAPVAVAPQATPANPFENLPPVTAGQTPAFQGGAAAVGRKKPKGKPGAKLPIPLVIGGLLTLLVLVGVGAAAMMMGDNESESAADATDTTTPADSVAANETEESQDSPPEVEPGPFQVFAQRLLRQFDGDGDDKLSESEIPEHERNRMMQVDFNNDGELDLAELSSLPPEPPRGPRGEGFRGEDPFGDGPPRNQMQERRSPEGPGRRAFDRPGNRPGGGGNRPGGFRGGPGRARPSPDTSGDE